MPANRGRPMNEAISTTSPLSAKQPMLVLIATSAPSFMLHLDANIVSVSLPAIARSLGASFAGIEWVVTAYLMSFAALLMPAGALADRFGRKKILIIGLSIFTFASLLCGSAPNLSVLIAARAPRRGRCDAAQFRACNPVARLSGRSA
jgi:MFS family permease